MEGSAFVSGHMLGCTIKGLEIFKKPVSERWTIFTKKLLYKTSLPPLASYISHHWYQHADLKKNQVKDFVVNCFL